MQKLQESVFSIIKTTSLSPAVFSFLQPSDDTTDKTPLGGILNDTRHGWLALGPKFCVVDLRTGLKVAAKIFGTPYSNSRTTITSVAELPVPLTKNSKQLIISFTEDLTSTICIFHINGSQTVRCIQTDLIVTQLVVCHGMPDGPFTSFDGVVMAGTISGEIFVFDLNRAGLIQAIKDISQGYEHLIQNENNPANLTFLPLNAVEHIEEQRDLALENNDHLAVLVNDNSLVDGQYIFRNPDSSIRMKAKRDHVRVTVMQYIPQLGSVVVGYNFGAFQIWNLLTLELEYTSQVNVECIPVTHFGFQEPCDDPRAFCYLWVVYSAIDRFEDEQFPLAVMYSLTYHGKRMLSDTKCLYQEFSMASIRFQVELTAMDDADQLTGGKCVSCHTYSINSTLGSEGEDSMLNICQLVWECWGDNSNFPSQYGMVLFDLDQWYKDQMPETYRLQSNAFMSATWCSELSGACALDARLEPSSVAPYSHTTRLEEHFYPNSLQYRCICLTTSEACVLSTVGIQRQIINSLDDVGPTALLNPPRLYNACLSAGLAPLYTYHYNRNPSQDEQRRFLLSVALEARLSRFLKRCAHDWATGTHSGAGCTLPFLVDWCWKRAIELKENAKELTAPLFSSSALPDRNVVRSLEHCVQQLTQLTGLLDAVLTKCCNLVVPDALSEMEEKYKGVGTVSLYFQVVQWFLRVGLLPERHDAYEAVSYPAHQLYATYNKRRLKLQRLEENSPVEDKPSKSCSLLYIDQLIENEFGGETIHQMWIKGGSECNGLYPPPSLYSLLRLYLLPGVAEEHKHSLVLYLLVDYSVIYDHVRYEPVIRRLMQFPTMFGLSNTAIKATQAFWHLDHRDFDFALDQLQCLTGNTLSEWQHNVVLSSLLAQKKTQAALQYLHVRKPAPIQIKDAMNSSRVNDHDKLEDWQPCCNLYLARGLVYEALDVIRMCVQNAGSMDDKIQILNFFFKGCRNTGHLSKILQITLLPLEEEVFIKYLQNCNETQTSDILVMYYLQQNRYIEAEQYNNKLKQNKTRSKEPMGSVESIAETADRESARDILVELACASLPGVASSVRDFILSDKEVEPHVIAPKPMSVYVQATSPKNTFTYKSSFIQDTIENASETWMNKPKTRRGLKRALNIEEVPFICTPKLNKSRSIFADQSSNSTSPKRFKLDLTATPKTPKLGSAVKLNDKLSKQMATLLDMPEVQSPDCKLYMERSGAGTPHSILKIRRNDMDREAPSPVDSRYLDDSEDDMLETASNHTHYSDSTNKHLRFTIPTASESGSTPSPHATSVAPAQEHIDIVIDRDTSMAVEDSVDDSSITTESHPINESHPLESPSKKLAAEPMFKSRKSYKDSVRGRRSLSISANSSLSEDPNTSIESIADIPITLINPRYSGEKLRVERERQDSEELQEEREKLEVPLPKTPKGRRGIRSDSESTPLSSSRSCTPERVDSPRTPLQISRTTRARSRTPDISPRSSQLEPIIEQKQEETETHPRSSTVEVSRQLRSKSRTPERMLKIVKESPRLEVISESPTKSSTASSSPSRRSLRSRSRTPEVEMKPEETRPASPHNLRSRAKTPETKSPKIDNGTKSKKSLSRIVLEANAFAKTKLNLEHSETEQTGSESTIECTPMKAIKQVPSLMDVTLSPIVHKSVLQSSTDSVLSETVDKDATKPEDKSIAELGLKPLPAFTTIHETYFEKSVLNSYQSSIADTSESMQEDTETKADETAPMEDLKSLPAFTTINDTGFKSVLRSYESSVAETSESMIDEGKQTKVTEVITKTFTEIIETNIDKSVLKSYNSSVAESSQDNNTRDTNNSALKDMSLITNDSDIEMKDNKGEWAKIESQDAASVIQKEKEKIVDIEREINELEGDMTDDDSNDAESTSGDEEIVQPADSEQSDEESSSETEESESANSESDEEIISIKDTDSEQSSSSEDKLRIDEETSSEKSKQNSETTSDENTNKETVEKETVTCDFNDKQTITEITNEEQKDPLNQAQISMLTDDVSVADSEQSDVNLNYSDESKPYETEVNKNVPMETEPTVEVIFTVEEVKDTSETNPVKTLVSKQIDVVDSVASTDKINVAEEKQETTSPIEKEPSLVNTSDDNKEKLIVEAESESIVPKENEAEVQAAGEISKPATRTSKRVKSITEKETEIVDEPKTPVTRKRTQSNTSNKTLEVEQKTPENENTPRRRARTPTSMEVRRIMTRRASKEIAEKLDESKEASDDIITPKRRSTRVRSKNIDDNESVTSESSVKSTRSRVSEDAGDVKTPARKGRKSIMTTKPDLSVIPEMIVEEESKSTEDIINDYSNSRRLTRNQKAVLESWLEPTTSPSRPRSRPASRGRRPSHDVESDASRNDEDETHPGVGVQTMDRISLLNKQDFDGIPDDTEGYRSTSPDSVASDASNQRRARLGRAGSESKALPKAAKVFRRISVDVAQSPDSVSPTLGTSPARGRRASFNKACEALHTPKGRRTSVDARKDTESPMESPVPSEASATPARRTRRAASTQSNTSQTKLETGKRSKKTSTLNESKDKN